MLPDGLEMGLLLYDALMSLSLHRSNGMSNPQLVAIELEDYCHHRNLYLYLYYQRPTIAQLRVCIKQGQVYPHLGPSSSGVLRGNFWYRT